MHRRNEDHKPCLPKIWSGALSDSHSISQIWIHPPASKEAKSQTFDTYPPGSFPTLEKNNCVITLAAVTLHFEDVSAERIPNVVIITATVANRARKDPLAGMKTRQICFSQLRMLVIDRNQPAGTRSLTLPSTASLVAKKIPDGEVARENHFPFALTTDTKAVRCLQQDMV